MCIDKTKFARVETNRNKGKIRKNGVLGVVTHIFNTFLITSIYPAAWQNMNIMLIASQALCRTTDRAVYFHDSPKLLKL
jgi:hypothetical protein